MCETSHLHTDLVEREKKDEPRQRCEKEKSGTQQQTSSVAFHASYMRLCELQLDHVCVSGRAHECRRSLMQSSCCKGNHALQHICLASYVFLADAVQRNALTAHASLESTVVVSPSTSVASLAASVADQNMLTGAP